MGIADLWRREDGNNRAIFGVDSKESGEIILDGETIHINNPMDAIRAAGIVAGARGQEKTVL